MGPGGMDPQMMGAILQQIQGGQGGGPPMGPDAPPQDYAGGGGPPPQGDQPDQGPGPQDPLNATKTVIQDMHSLIATLPDAAHTKMATQAMHLLLTIQKDLMSTQQTASQQGVM